MWNFRRQTKNLNYEYILTKDELSNYSFKPITNHEKNMTFKRYDWDGIRRCKKYANTCYKYTKDSSRWRFDMERCNMLTPQDPFNNEYSWYPRSATRIDNIFMMRRHGVR